MGLSLRRSLTWTRKSRVARCPESLIQVKRKYRATRSRQDQPARFHVYCCQNNRALCILYSCMYHDTQGEMGTWSKVERMGLATLCHVLGGGEDQFDRQRAAVPYGKLSYTAHMGMQTDQQFYVLSHVR